VYGGGRWGGEGSYIESALVTSRCGSRASDDWLVHREDPSPRPLPEYREREKATKVKRMGCVWYNPRLAETSMKITPVGSVLVLGLALASCNENQPAKTEAPVRQNNLLSALQNGAVTYSPNVTAEQQMPGRREVNLPGAALMPA